MTNEKKIFDTVAELVAAIGDDDTREPFVVTHRKVDYYVLADDDVEALAIVFTEKSSAIVENVPLSEIMKVVRDQTAKQVADDAKASTSKASKKPTAKSADAAS